MSITLAYGLLESLVYGAVGLGLIFVVFAVIDAMTPGHLGKQLTEEHNMPMAIVAGSAIIGASIIIAAAIAG
jgi:putative membrane protein